MITGDKIDAHKALYAYETPDDVVMTSDPHGLLFSVSPAKGCGLPKQKLPPIPVLIAEGMRDVFSVDTVSNHEVLMETNGEDFTLNLVGLMSKAGNAGFSGRKVVGEI